MPDVMYRVPSVCNATPLVSLIGIVNGVLLGDAVAVVLSDLAPVPATV